jgi:uncharacterized protein (TIGR02271 family)
MTNALDQRVIGTTAYDSQGSKLGKIKELYIDDRTSSPKWISVHTGLFGLSESLVPLAGASSEGDSVRVAVTKDAVTNAPHVGSAERITPDEENELISHYGIRSQAPQTPQAAHTPQATPTAQTPQAPLATESEPKKHDTSEFAQHAPVPDGKRVTPPTDDTTETRESAVVRSEERLDVGTQREEYGTARIRKYTTTEQESVSVPVTREEVRVIREPIDNPASVKGEPFTDAEREVTLHEDQIVVEKRSVPVERVRLGVEEVTDQKTVQEAVRKEHIETDGIGTSDDHPRHRK